MCDEKSPLNSGAEDVANEATGDQTASRGAEMCVGSFDEIANGLSIRYAGEESFDTRSMLTRADMAVPGAAAVADAVSQYGYALVRFPEGKSWNDLMPRKTSGYEGWSHFATYGENGDVGGGNAAIKQAGLQPASIANLAMQGAAMAVGLAYMARIDGKLSEISKGIDDILRYMEEDYISRIEGHAEFLADYMEGFEEYATSIEERISVITNAQRIYEKLRGYWRKELRRMEDLRNELDRQGKTIKEADARGLLQKYFDIDNRMRHIFGLAVISRQMLMQYASNYSSGRIRKERQTILSMRDAYVGARDETVCCFNEIAKKIKAPLSETVPSAIREQVEPKADLKRVMYGLLFGGYVGATVRVAGLAIRVSSGIDGVNSRRQSEYLKDVETVANYIDDTTQAYIKELDDLDFRFNKANAFLIGRDGLYPLVVTDATNASSGALRNGDSGSSNY